jgi:undecaprenyl-diphosphatase
MQLGNFVAVPIAAAVAAAFRRFRLALAILAAGLAAYFLAKVVKGLVVRGRPSSLLDDVVIRGSAAGGRGYVSGHAAVATLLLVLVWPYLGRPWRWVALGVAVFVCLARVYVGAHLPLDVIGGAALGLALGGLARLAFGRPART